MLYKTLMLRGFLKKSAPVNEGRGEDTKAQRGKAPSPVHPPPQKKRGARRRPSFTDKASIVYRSVCLPAALSVSGNQRGIAHIFPVSVGQDVMITLPCSCRPAPLGRRSDRRKVSYIPWSTHMCCISCKCRCAPACSCRIRHKDPLHSPASSP